MAARPPATRQSGPEAKTAPRDALHTLKPGGPIQPTKQGFVNPGPTNNLRGVEPNTAMHRGTPNQEQQGTAGKHGDHNPGMDAANDTRGHGVPPAPHIQGRHSAVSKKQRTPEPGDFAR